VNQLAVLTLEQFYTLLSPVGLMQMESFVKAQMAFAMKTCVITDQSWREFKNNRLKVHEPAALINNVEEVMLDFDLLFYLILSLISIIL
jgi:hypothetical protein